ncbi:protein of unknown function DUF2800 [Vibrio phage 13VV501A]|nr:protein of unknown function DUF2800 [Vibrio phage 13VV501A]
MLKETLTHIAPLCASLETQLDDFDGDASYIAHQSAELVMWVQTLQTLFTGKDRRTLDALDESIASLQAARSALLADVEQRIANGQEVEGFTMKAGAITRRIPDYNMAVMALSALGVDESKLFEQKPLGVPAIEKLLKASGLKPDDREAVMVQFVEAVPGKMKVEKL